MQTPEGAVVGQHDGLMYYTLGQRQGLGIGGTAGSSGQAWYVLEKNLQRNILVVGQGGNHPLLYKQGLRAQPPHWIGIPPEPSFRCQAKTRYRQPDQGCLITKWDEHGLEVIFDEPQRAMTPGQSVVFYQGQVCLGGAVIAETFNP